MSKQNLSLAEELFHGRVSYGPANHSKRGVAVALLSVLALGAPAVADADALIVAATSTELPDTETVTYTYPAANVSPTDAALRAGTLDVPRNVVAVVTHGSSVVAMTIRVTGEDQYGATMIEDLAITATGTSKTATGKKAFKTISSVAITAAADAEANTLNLGTGNALGLPIRVDSNGVFQKLGAGLLDTGTMAYADTTSPATATTGDIRGTITPSTTLNGSNQIAVLAKAAGVTTKVQAYGVAQYSG